LVPQSNYFIVADGYKKLTKFELVNNDFVVSNKFKYHEDESLNVYFFKVLSKKLTVVWMSQERKKNICPHQNIPGYLILLNSDMEFVKEYQTDK